MEICIRKNGSPFGRSSASFDSASTGNPKRQDARRIYRISTHRLASWDLLGKQPKASTLLPATCYLAKLPAEIRLLLNAVSFCTFLRVFSWFSLFSPCPAPLFLCLCNVF